MNGKYLDCTWLPVAVFILDLLGDETPPNSQILPWNAETWDKSYRKYKIHPPNLIVHLNTAILVWPVVTNI